MSLETIKRIIFFLLTGGIILIVVLGLLSIRNFFTEDEFEFNTSSKTVIKELRELNRLETAAFTIEKVIDAGTTGNRFQEVLFGDRILLIAHGEVIAGFDLSKLGENNVQIDGTTLQLTLPPPQILVTRLDNEQTRVYDRRQGLLTKGNDNLEAEARHAAEQEIREAACMGNILDEASKNARNQLGALFKTLGFTSVTISIPEVGC